eukprot:CAMPEP_0119395104 /NCGR_PEP_ID=MMETSP1334-20130426/132041_1 /TAXON_ID=127549 /ORGANISM="Calcidiscus leptoporus, Strain RCC1130" /LENGTH=109 /DNA_ID=CAMNT_0007418529 /DNA_START=263 /DNA_END=590 /DNA_ORIENTATION=+
MPQSPQGPSAPSPQDKARTGGAARDALCVENDGKTNQRIKRAVVEPSGEGAVGDREAGHDTLERLEVNSESWHGVQHHMQEHLAVQQRVDDWSHESERWRHLPTRKQQE